MDVWGMLITFWRQIESWGMFFPSHLWCHSRWENVHGEGRGCTVWQQGLGEGRVGMSRPLERKTHSWVSSCFWLGDWSDSYLCEARARLTRAPRLIASRQFCLCHFWERSWALYTGHFQVQSRRLSVGGRHGTHSNMETQKCVDSLLSSLWERT